MKTVIIIQARMGSTRLPGKVLKKLGGQPVLWHVIQRSKACPLVDEVVVATTTSEKDQAIVSEAQACGARTFCGSEDDVLSRYFEAAQEVKADLIVRVTADCPLYDPILLEKMLKHFQDLVKTGVKIDYLSNIIKRTFPRGFDTEIFRFTALEMTHREATKPYQREHVTPFIYQNTRRFRSKSYEGEHDLSKYRWTLSTDEDYRFLQEVFSALQKGKALFTTGDVLRLLKEKPELAKINAHVEQKRDTV